MEEKHSISSIKLTFFIIFTYKDASKYTHPMQHEKLRLMSISRSVFMSENNEKTNFIETSSIFLHCEKKRVFSTFFELFISKRWFKKFLIHTIL